MVKLFKCPKCNARFTVDDPGDSVECPYCHYDLFGNRNSHNTDINSGVTEVDNTDHSESVEENIEENAVKESVIQLQNNKTEVMKCPDCGGKLDFDLTGREFVFCPYCGTQLHVNNGTVNIKITKHIIDEAEVIRANKDAPLTGFQQNINKYNEEYTNRVETKLKAKIERDKLSLERKIKEKDMQLEIQQKNMEYLKGITPTLIILLLFMAIICITLIFVVRH